MPDDVRAFDIGEPFRYGWRTFSANPGPLVIAAIALFVANGILGWLVRNAGSGVWFLALLQFVVTGLINLAIVRLALDYVDGRTPDVRPLFERTDVVVGYLAATFLYWLAVGVGFMLLILPGVYLLVALFFFGYLVVDKAVAPIDALTRSRDLVSGRWGLVFRAGLVALLLNFIGVLAFGVGLLVSYPVTMIAAAWIYRWLVGEPVPSDPMAA